MVIKNECWRLSPGWLWGLDGPVKKAFRASAWSTLWLLPARGQSLQLSVVCDTQWWGLDSSCPNIYFSIVLPWISYWKDPRVGSICNVMIFCSSAFSSSFSVASLELMEILLLACYTYGTDGSIMMSYSPMRLPSLSMKLGLSTISCSMSVMLTEPGSWKTGCPLQQQIQDFSDRVANPKGAPTYYLANITSNHWKEGVNFVALENRF